MSNELFESLSDRDLYRRAGKVHMLNGDSFIVERVLNVTRTAIVIEADGENSPLLIPMHAILCVALQSPKEPTP